MVFPDGGAVFALHALLGNPRAHYLRQAVNVHGVDMHTLLDFPAHGFCPGLGTEDADPQRQPAGIDSLPLHLVGNVEHVGRSDHDDIRVEIADELNLLFGLPTGHGDDSATEHFSAVMGAETAGKQAIAVGDMHFVGRDTAGRPNGAGHHLGPGFDILPGITHDRGLACGAAGCMHPHDLLHGHGKHTERVVVAQLGLGGEGKPPQVLEGHQVIRVHPVVVKPGPVDRAVAVGVL